MKTAVITGANSGMGFVTAKALAEQGFCTVLVCRNETKAWAATEHIISRTGNKHVYFYLCDLSDITATKQLTSLIITNHPVIDILINNAGLYIDQRKTSAQGYELTFANNHLSYFAMTEGLMPALKNATNARIVNVASEAQQYGKLNFDDLQLTKKYKPMLAYGNSKLYNIMFTLALAKKLEGSTITANCMHPGGVHTNFAKGAGGLVGFIFNILGFMLRPPEKGADTIIWLATANEANGLTGKYFFDRKPIKAQADAYKKENLERLWSITEKMYKNA